MKSADKSRRWDWIYYFTFLAIGLSVFLLSTTGYSKIVLIITLALSIMNVIYSGVFSRRWALAIFFTTLGISAIAVYIFLPQSDSPFGWDKIASIFLGAVAGKISFMLYYHGRKEK